MTLSLGRQLIHSGTCADVQELARNVAEVIEALGNPGPPVAPGETTPCGEIYGPAYVRNDGGSPALSYVDSDGICQDITTSG